MPVFPCNHHACLAHVKRRGDVCPEHAGNTRTSRQDYQRHYDRFERDQDAKDFYNSKAWKVARAAKLAECPFCERCWREWAEHVHHIIALKRCTPAQRTARENLMSLCPGCHTIIEREAQMFIVTNDARANERGPFLPRTIYDVTDNTAATLISANRAAEMPEPPQYVRELFARMDDGADRPVIFRPFTGEFGHEVMSHMRLVHWSRASEKLVCCRAGHEVLYPSATAFVTDWTDPTTDAQRVSTIPHDVDDWPAIIARFPDHIALDGANGLSPEQQIFAIHPDQRIELRPKMRGLKADVVFGVRHREFAPERNWTDWQTLADAARAAGLTFAVIGNRATSFDLAGQVAHSGDYDTDAAVELLQSCRLFVGTDSGAAHLAATVRARMLIFRERLSGSRDLTPRMALVNPHQVDVVAGGWERPDLVADRMLAALAPEAVA